MQTVFTIIIFGCWRLSDCCQVLLRFIGDSEVYASTSITNFLIRLLEEEKNISNDYWIISSSDLKVDLVDYSWYISIDKPWIPSSRIDKYILHKKKPTMHSTVTEICGMKSILSLARPLTTIDRFNQIKIRHLPKILLCHIYWQISFT